MVKPSSLKFENISINSDVFFSTVRDFILGGGSKITTDGDCSHEIKRCLLLGRKAMSNLDSIFIYLLFILFCFVFRQHI